MDVTIIDLLRHGECQGGEIFRGTTDVELTDKGWRQMQVSSACESAPWQQIITSPLKRCALFAEQLAAQHQLPCTRHQDFAEISFGDWEGCLVSDVEREQGENLKKFWHSPTTNTPPNGEPMVAFSDRLDRGWQSLLADYRGQHLLLVNHGGALRVLLTKILSMPLDAIVQLDVPYACFTRVKIYHSNGRSDWSQLVSHNTSIEMLG
ncbi:Adenosylcobalamin/alpha-ribazole phosphatase [Sinobacterium norvegicum]|uniref:Adenosylcobalamin/alpha-ribazole phosphatase n=1 Tax=Sinobacterium norvegicum TaxID=1641715 RepID=A0ABM9ADR6_9GAMM|nr:histidine phosphatase family protein [Sinobacterium norvegicum]CAH0991355.1 Adenosylcobalamin/alpha-ribazole phosphatase [Sinobacterium norvegicum]